MTFFSSRVPQKGFTLVELLVVVAIIGLLVSIVSVSLSGARKKARDSRRSADLKTIQLALSTYYTDNGFFPVNIYSPSNTVPGVSSPSNGLAPAYLPVVPKDPNNATANCNVTGLNSETGCYHYNAYTVSSSQICTSNYPVLYHLGAAFEETTNPSLTQDTNLSAGGGNTSVSYNSFTYYRCSGGQAPSAQFDGDAANCSGTTVATPDPCYDLTP